MTDTIGRGVIEISADATKMKAGFDEARRSIRTLGEGQKEISKSAQRSIDTYIEKLQLQNAAVGRSIREQELFKLSLRGASQEQLKAADAAIRLADAHKAAASATAKSAAINQTIAGLKQQNAEFGKSQTAIELYRLKLQGASEEQLKTAAAALRLGEAQRAGAQAATEAQKARDRSIAEAQKVSAKAAADLAEKQAQAVAKSAGIDKYILGLRQQNAEFGKSNREVELYRLGLQGASKEQLAAADSALRLAESHQRGFVAAGLLRNALIGISIAAAGALTAKAFGSIEFLQSLDDLHKSTGIAVEDLAGLNLLAKQTGTDLGGLAKGINKMSVEMGKNPDQFRELGVTATDSVEAFKQLADIFNTIPDISLRNALAQKVFSKSWQELAPALAEGSSGIAQAIEKGKRLSGITEEMTKQADQFGDQLEELKIRGAAFGASFLPQLIEIVKWLGIATDAVGKLFGAMGKAQGDPIASLDKRISALQEQQTAHTSSGLKRFFFADDAAILGKQIASLQEERAKLTATIPAADNDRELRRLKGQQAAALARNIGDSTAAANRFLKEPKTGGGGGGAAKAEIDTSRQDAAAQLQFDLQQIKAAGSAQVEAFRNSEQIMEALRSAQLIQDKEYYDSKLGFIRLFAQAQIAELEAEIKRRKQEVFTGKEATKDQIDNERKIKELQAQISKAREDETTKITINAIKTQEALDKIAQGYQDARDAAKDYLDTISRRNEREIAGIGQGARFREVNAGRSEIDDRRAQERQKLERDLRRGQIDRTQFDTYLQVAEETYAKEVALYEQRTDAIRAAEADWINGANEALNNYLEETRNVAKQFEDVFTRAFSSIEDFTLNLFNGSIKNFKDLKSAVTDLVGGIAADLARIEIRQQITGPLAESLKGNLPQLGSILGFNAGKAGTVASDAASGAAFGTTVTAAGTGFGTVVTTAGATFGTEVTAAGAAFLPEITGAGAAFAGEVTAAGLAFASSVTGAAAGSSIAEGGGLIGSVLDSFATGVAYVPKTGPYMLHQGERVVPAAENASGGGGTINITVNPPAGMSKQTASQLAVETGRQVNLAQGRRFSGAAR